MTSLWAVVPAAGSGRRMASEVPKQYLKVAGLTLLEHTLRALMACGDIRGIAVVLDPSDRRADGIGSLADPRIIRARGGQERADSVLSGLRALSDMAAAEDWALVHDAARPCLPVADLNRLIDRVLTTGTGGLLARPCSDTIKRVDEDGRVSETLDRGFLWQAQTPQMFRIADLTEALEHCLGEQQQVTDEASAMERAGYPVQVVEGPACNLKVTVPEDLVAASSWLTDASVGQS